MLRECLTGWLASAFTWALIHVAPKPSVPLSQRFIVDMTDGDGDHDLVATLLFVPCELGEWHVATVLEHRDEKPWLLDSAVGRCWAWPMRGPGDYTPVLAALKPEYVVEVRTKSKGWMRHSTIGPVTCITLAKRLIGVHNPGIVTSRQLLAKLREIHNGCS